MDQSFDVFHFFLFVIPGFITVWSFRYFTNSKKSADFEYFALSVFWGLIMILVYDLIGNKEGITIIVNNPYAGAIVLSILGLIISCFGSIVSRSDWFIGIVKWLKSRNLNIKK